MKCLFRMHLLFQQTYFAHRKYSVSAPSDEGKSKSADIKSRELKRKEVGWWYVGMQADYVASWVRRVSEKCQLFMKMFCIFTLLAVLLFIPLLFSCCFFSHCEPSPSLPFLPAHVVCSCYADWQVLHG